MKKIVFFMLVGGFIFFITGIACAQSEEEYRILEKVNRERMVRNLHPLSWDGQLAKIARKYSKEMACTGNFSHYDNKETLLLNVSMKVASPGGEELGRICFLRLILPSPIWPLLLSKDGCDRLLIAKTFYYPNGG